MACDEAPLALMLGGWTRDGPPLQPPAAKRPTKAKFNTKPA
jgi:hypothetical protein